MWANTDDQGRLCGDPEEVKYAVCPNIDHITKADVPELLKELEQNSLITVYETPKSTAIQMLDWWDVQRLQWAWPSDYPSPDGWKDRLRYKRGAREVVTQNWPVSDESQNGAQVSGEPIEGEAQNTVHLTPIIVSGEQQNHIQVNSPTEKIRPKKNLPATGPLPSQRLENEKEKRKRRGRGNSPESSGEKPATTSENQLLHFLSSLKNWRFDEADDLAWLREFSQEWLGFDVSLAKACRDYHSGRSPPEHKGVWKNRLREWMNHERKYQEERHGRSGEHRQRAGPSNAKPYEWEEAPDEPGDTS